MPRKPPTPLPSAANEPLGMALRGLQRHRRAIIHRCASLRCTITWEEDATQAVERLDIEIRVDHRHQLNVTLWSTQDAFIYLGDPHDKSHATSFHGRLIDPPAVGLAIKTTLSEGGSESTRLRTIWSKTLVPS